MIRRVAFRKAIFAGILGAAAWEVAARFLKLLGLPVFDLVRSLGTIAIPEQASAWQWWPAGMVVHCVVGSIWAIFYAYFFWSTFNYRPIVQGLLFSLLPIVLVGMVMVPQMDWMHPGIVNGGIRRNGMFAIHTGFGGPAMLVLGHLIYGAVLGSLYVRPVGYPTRRRVQLHVWIHVRYGN
jgi:hypothetical protein